MEFCRTMMISGRHTTRYHYGAAVSFGPHLLYLRPREDEGQRLRSFSLSVEPDSKLYPSRDAFDNALTWMYAPDSATSLTIHTTFEIETHLRPFQFILRDYAVQAPFVYEPFLALALQPYLRRPAEAEEAALSAWLGEALNPAPKTDTVRLLVDLTRAISERFQYESREEGASRAGRATLEMGSGSCRDFAMLLVEFARTLGLAARFVSGYLYAPEDDSIRFTGSMHAWTEIFLPGGGWVAFDPTHGRACDDAYIAVAHAAEADHINPIQGTYHGAARNGAQLTTEVELERL